ncbi:hypothetical protein OUZ56_018316 [Daphnia magna]|uniref:Uncharacterized protein n=1 Tax=Daphnia magna TaxID=35525 RepID=A0ABQ9Z8I7_9CRUS|nr:hypothetical protein OUZ56_018316 [Daphnia magna]
MHEMQPAKAISSTPNNKPQRQRKCQETRWLKEEKRRKGVLQWLRGYTLHDHSKGLVKSLEDNHNLAVITSCQCQAVHNQMTSTAVVRYIFNQVFLPSPHSRTGRDDTLDDELQYSTPNKQRKHEQF